MVNMTRRLLSAFAVAGLWTVAASAQSAKATLDAAATALGATSLNSIQFSGWGSDYIFGQAYDGNLPWPRFYLPGITVTIDYRTPAWRDDRRRTQVQNPPLGGGFQPLVGEQRQIWVLSGTYAWDVVGQGVAPAAVERDMRSAGQGRTTQIYLTPLGFSKVAQAGSAAVHAENNRDVKTHVI